MAKYDPTKANKRWMLYVVSAAIIAWAAWWSVIQLPINDVTKTLFLALFFVAIVCTTMPALAYLNARFGQFEASRVYRVRFIRQSVMVGAFVVLLAWLQMQRVLGTSLALILLAVFVLIETFLITRESPAKEL
jgi:hypothetical protein